MYARRQPNRFLCPPGVRDRFSSSSQVGAACIAGILALALLLWLAFSANGPSGRGTRSGSSSACGGPPLPALAHREDVIRLLCERESLRSIAEVGVMDGFFAHAILTACPAALYVGVDHLATPKDDDAKRQASYKEAAAQLKPFEGRWRLLRGDGAATAADFPDGHFDLVYLDAHHDYRAVQDDLRAWAPKVRPGGIIAGHDFLDASDAGAGWMQNADARVGKKAVRSPVTEFADVAGRQLAVTYGDIWEGLPFPSWFMRV